MRAYTVALLLGRTAVIPIRTNSIILRRLLTEYSLPDPQGQSLLLALLAPALDLAPKPKPACVTTFCRCFGASWIDAKCLLVLGVGAGSTWQQLLPLLLLLMLHLAVQLPAKPLSGTGRGVSFV